MLIYLIGGRGTGKTTSAKILARAVNCLNPKNGEPCNECEICKEILDGSLTDVVEMDAASNTSVEDIRSICNEANFLPTKAKYRVYIIDEVHMITVQAFNALLKTLEEPPEHVKFILATTEPQKIPATILSRCQRFDFKKITNENIIKRLKIICKESNIKISEEALTLIAVLAEGAMRDGISILERCYQESTDEIEVDLVKELVGIPKLDYISKITEAILKNDEILALNVIDEVIDSGKDLSNFLWEIIKYLKDVLIIKASGKLFIYNEKELKEIKKISELSSKDRILNLIYYLSKLANDIKWSSQKTIMFQAGIIRSCISIENNGIEELRNRVEELENIVLNGKNVNYNSSNNTKTSKLSNMLLPKKYSQLTNEENINEQNVSTNNNIENNFKEQTINENNSSINWSNIINSLRSSGKVRLFTSLANTKINQQGDLILEIIFPNGLTPFVKGILEDSSNKKDLDDILFKETGKQWHIKLIDGKNSNSTSSNEKSKSKSSSNSINGLGIDINIIE